MTKTILTILFAGATAFAAQNASDYLPLQPGNEWTYRDQRGLATMTVRVGTPALIGGNVYHRLIGYVAEPLWVRFNADTLVYRDEERNQDLPLTLFASLDGPWFHAPFRGCEQEGQASERPVGYTGPAGAYEAALQIRYRSFGCADSGIEEEIYQPSIGMLRRTVLTFAGPRHFELVSARIGRIHIVPENTGAFQVSVRKPLEADTSFTATLRLTLDQPMRVRKPSGQDYDVVLKDESGQTIWRWSEGKVFPAGIEERILSGREEYDVTVPAPRQPGKYTVEAWLTAGDERILFSAATSVEF